MWCLQAAIRGRHATRLHGRESELAVVISFDAAEAQKARRGRIVPGIVARITARRISLPNFQYRVRHYFSVTIEHFAAYGDSLAGNAVGDEIFAFQVNKSEVKKRADGLRSGRRHGRLLVGKMLFFIRRDLTRGTHRRASTGVDWRPRRMMSNRKPSAWLGMVVSQSKSEMSRFRAFSSGMLLKTGSNGSK